MVFDAEKVTKMLPGQILLNADTQQTVSRPWITFFTRIDFTFMAMNGSAW